MKRGVVLLVVVLVAAAGTAVARSLQFREIARSNRAPRSATVRVHGTAVATTPAVIGIRLNRAALLRRLSHATAVVAAPYTRIAPTVGDAAARSAAARARALIAQPVAVAFHGTRLGALTPLQLARSLKIDGATVSLDGDKLASVVRP